MVGFTAATLVPETELNRDVNQPLDAAMNELVQMGHRELARRLQQAYLDTYSIGDFTARMQAQDAISDLISQMQNGRLTVEAVSMMLQRVETQISQAKAAEQTSGAQLSDALYGRLPLSAAGRQYAMDFSNAWNSNDVPRLIDLTMHERMEFFPNREAQRDVRAGVTDYFTSPDYEAHRRAFARYTPDQIQAGQQRRIRRSEWTQNFLQTQKDSPFYSLIEGAHNNGLEDQPGFSRIIEAINRNAPVEEVRGMIDQLTRDAAIVGGRVPNRPTLQYDRSQFLNALTPDQRARVNSPEDLDQMASSLLQDTAAVRRVHDWQLRHPNERMDRLPNDLRPTYLAMRYRNNVRNDTEREFELRELDLMVSKIQEIDRVRASGQELQGELLEYATHLTEIEDQSRPVLERARLMVGTAGARMRSGSQDVLTPEGQLGRAIVTLSFTDQHGGLRHHLEMMRRASDNPRGDEEARRYMEEFRVYEERKLLNGEVRGGNRNILVQDAQIDLGRAVGGVTPTPDATPDTHVAIINGELRYFGRDDPNYNGRTSFYGSGTERLIQAVGGPAEMVRNLYRDVHSSTPAAERDPRANNPEYVQLIRDIDTYRLQTDPGCRAIIETLYRGEPMTAEMRTAVNNTMRDEQNGMQPYNALVLSRADDYQRSLLQRYNLIKPDGTMDIPALMQRIDANKSTPEVYTTWRDNADKPMSQLSPALREARALSELASQLRSAHSIEHLIERGNTIADALDEGTGMTSMLAEDRRMYWTLMGYNPETATKEQRDEFHTVLRRYLMRDDYTRRKEEADETFRRNGQPGECANLVNNTIEIIEARLRREPDLFRGGADRDYDHDAPAPSPSPRPIVGPLPVEDLPDPAPAPTAQPDQSWRTDRREREGSGGLDAMFDQMQTTPLERALMQARGAVSADVWLRTLAPLVGTYNEGDLAYLSINEVEKALKHAGIKNPNQIADVNNDGRRDIEDIRAALAQAGAGQATTVAPVATGDLQSQSTTAVTPPADLQTTR